MVEYLCTGICCRVYTEKSTVRKPEMMIDQLEKILQNVIDKSLFNFSKTKQRYIQELQPGHLTKEKLLPFLKEFHFVRYVRSKERFYSQIP